MEWFESTQIAAYYLWEHSIYDNALDLWYCAEDIASHFEQANILDAVALNNIKEQGKGSDAYIWFVRHVAYRLYIYTNNDEALTNWFMAESLLESEEWLKNIFNMASILKNDNGECLSQVRSDAVRFFYEGQTF
jgi:hypothetical protein